MQSGKLQIKWRCASCWWRLRELMRGKLRLHCWHEKSCSFCRAMRHCLADVALVDVDFLMTVVCGICVTLDILIVKGFCAGNDRTLLITGSRPGWTRTRNAVPSDRRSSHCANCTTLCGMTAVDSGTIISGSASSL